jgi:hypothetical protein
MPTTTETPFYELVKLANDFVIQQRGVWDHSAWMDFLSRVEKKEINLSGNMESSLGEMIEAIKQFHMAILSIEGTMLALDKLVRDSAEFIMKNKGMWGHAEWVAYSRGVDKNTIYLSEEMSTYLGGILESMKAFYITAPSSLVTLKKSSKQVTEEEKDT